MRLERLFVLALIQRFLPFCIGIQIFLLGAKELLRSLTQG